MNDRDEGMEAPGDLRPPWSESRRFVPRRFVQPVLEYMRTEAAGGVFMLVAAAAALIMANSPGAGAYERLWETPLTIDLGGVLEIEHTLREWVNDALMVFFFFVVGLEIKREAVTGELRDPRAAAVPVVAALGGMVVPAGIYLALNAGTEAAGGWGIPMATDIAFAVGVVSLLGRRVPVGAKLFVLTLAVADDVGAILVIAVFYTDDLAPGWLLAAVVGLGLVVLLQRLQVRATAMYAIVGFFVWLAMLESGVHATLAGVALGLLTPARPFYRPDDFPPHAAAMVERVEAYAGDPNEAEDHRTTERIQSLLRDLTRLSRETASPLDRLEHLLAPWTSFVVVPIFAFANAGVTLGGDAVSAALASRVALGVFLGLLVGKTVGVTAATWLAVASGLGRLPRNTTWHQVVGLGMLAGIGFTVALFVTVLAFGEGPFADQAKIGIFAASLLAGVFGYLWLRLGGRRTRRPATDDEEELAAV